MAHVTIKHYGAAEDNCWEFECSCGNNPNGQGAYPCDGEGIEVPEDQNWANLWCCDNCGVIFNGEVGDVVGQRTAQK